MTTRTENLARIPKTYNPSEVEGRIYKSWMDNGYFQPRIQQGKRPFVIIMPPPNVTGELHLGHALTAAAEDALVRWHRMMGDPTLWLPGSDHAGIATQVVVERQLVKEGKNRHEIGREAFVGRVWEWVRQYGRTIAEQHKRLGASCDWSRERFTLDEGPSRAVRTTFVNLYQKGLIYRGERIINWCPRCSTALSDLEVIHQEVDSKLYYIRYPHASNPDKYLTVATTRPETLLGDTAVAVNPDDERFANLVGQDVLLPRLNRPIPVITDSVVDLEFGTGAVKVTPAHDPNDFEIGQRHKLPLVTVIGPQSTMTHAAGPQYQGMTVAECRTQILHDLESDGLLEKVEPLTHSVGHCQRCNTVVDPTVGKQWFVKVGPMADAAARAVTENRIRIVPDRFTKVYLNWMDNIRDWCISRQLWWGHRIPVWYCNGCDHLTVSLQDPTTCEACASPDIRQDPDVLDTWFSSGLWPHSTLGWPDDTEDLRYFYPGSVLETGYDILFFWVARMIMMGIQNMDDIPFHTVYLHGLIQDEHGEKMSKVKGNVLNPLEIIDEHGADALRFALTVGTAPGNDSRLSQAKIRASRNFTNKLWNASRYVISILDQSPSVIPAEAGIHPSPATQEESSQSTSNMSFRGSARNLGLAPSPSSSPTSDPLPNPPSVIPAEAGIHPSLPIEDRWVLSRYNRTVEDVTRALTGFRLGDAQEYVHDFIWNEFCDWYIEIAKVRLRDSSTSPSPAPVLAHVLDGVLRLLHPFMPFITEEIWQSLVQRMPSPIYRPGFIENVWDQFQHQEDAAANNSGSTEERWENFLQEKIMFADDPDSIMIAPYPTPDPSLFDQEAEEWANLLMSLVRGVRNVRAERKVEASKKIPAVLLDGETLGTGGRSFLETLASCSLEVRPGDADQPENSIMVIEKATRVFLPLAGLFDFAGERHRLESTLADLRKRIGQVESRLSNEQFLAKAPPNVVEKERTRLSGWQEEESNLLQRLSELSQ